MDVDEGTDGWEFCNSADEIKFGCYLVCSDVDTTKFG